MNRSVKNYVVIESSHLFRAGEKFSTQFFVVDVANYLAREVYGFEGGHQTIALFGSTKEDQALKYIQSLTRHGIEVMRMNPIDSRSNNGKKFYKPLLYLHKIFHEIPLNSRVALVGFHNHRYEEILTKYQGKHEIHVSAFSTSTSRGDWMKIPEHWKRLCASCMELDSHVDLIKEEFHHSKSIHSKKGH
jgi:hypothetical protein